MKKKSLDFKTKNIIELNDQQSLTINGGTGNGVDNGGSSTCNIDVRTTSVSEFALN